MGRSYIPSSDSGLRNWANNFVVQIAASAAVYGLVAADVTAITDKVNKYDDAMSVLQDPTTKTPAAVAAKDDAKTIMLACLRPYATTIAASAGISNDAKAAIGVTIRDVSRSVVPAPASIPVLTFDVATPLQARIKVTDQNTPKSRAKPAGTIGLEVRCLVGAVAPISADATPYKGFASRAPMTLDFQAGDGGKTAYVYARWLNGKGQTGPWSTCCQFTVQG